MHLPAAEVLGGSWLPATMSIALVCTHSPRSAKYLTYSPRRWDKEKSQALFVTSRCPRKPYPAYGLEAGHGFACSAPSSMCQRARMEVPWLPGDAIPAAAIASHQQHHFPDIPTGLSSASAHPCLGKHRQLVSPTAGHVPDGAPLLCLCMTTSRESARAQTCHVLPLRASTPARHRHPAAHPGALQSAGAQAGRCSSAFPACSRLR